MASSVPAGTVPQTTSGQAAACSLGADNPSVSNGTITGAGSRTGCEGTVTLTVQVRKHRAAWPDKVVAETSRTGYSNGSLRASGNCDGEGTYFTAARSSGGKTVVRKDFPVLTGNHTGFPVKGKGQAHAGHR